MSRIKNVIDGNNFSKTKLSANNTLFHGCYFRECTCGLIEYCHFEECIFKDMELIVDNHCIVSKCELIDATIRIGKPKPEPWSVS